MGKVLSAQQIREADAYTMKYEPITSVDLMERAASACFSKILELYPNERVFHVFCGTGNNGGDGLVVARLLQERGLRVYPYIVRFSPNESEDFSINYERLNNCGLQSVDITTADSLQLTEGVIVDALLGSGVTRKVEGMLGSVIKSINNSSLPVISIDFPSGLFGESNTDENRSVSIRASHTLTFEVYKLAFLLPENHLNVGKLHILDIGLDKAFLNSFQTDYETLSSSVVESILHVRDEYSHKGTFGHALICSGSLGKMGATILCSQACLRSGTGLLTVFIPSCGYEIIQSSVPEAMAMCSTTNNWLSGTVEAEKFSAIGVGPGIGTNKETAEFIQYLLENTKKGLVLDADALNIIAQKELHNSIPNGSILTPHPKEFDRLFGDHPDTHSRIQTARRFAKDLNCVIILKGRHTAIISHLAPIYFNLTGNSGMASGGSGDVLTGIITGLLAQGYSAVEAALLAVYVHGYAGDLAAKEKGEEAMIASDITSHLGDAFKLLHHE